MNRRCALNVTSKSTEETSNTMKNTNKIRIIYVSNMPITADANGKIVAERDNMQDAERYLKNHVNVIIDPTPDVQREWLKPSKHQ